MNVKVQHPIEPPVKKYRSWSFQAQQSRVFQAIVNHYNFFVEVTFQTNTLTHLTILVAISVVIKRMIVLTEMMKTHIFANLIWRQLKRCKMRTPGKFELNVHPFLN